MTGGTSRVKLPPAIQEPFTVYVSGVQQRPGVDFELRGRELVFARELVQEGKLGFWRWFLGAWGIGTYRRDDQVDIAYDDGGPRVAHLPLEHA